MNSSDYRPPPIDLYGYYITEHVAIIFIVFFTVSTGVHLVQASCFRLPWLAWILVPAGLLEIIGWSGRLWNSLKPQALTAYLMQLCCLAIAPGLITCALYLLLGLVINNVGPQYARYSPKWYTIVFCTGDFISVILQCVGGSRATISVLSRPMRDSSRDVDLQLGGIASQMVLKFLFIAMGSEFLIRWACSKPFRRAPSQSLEKPLLSSLAEPTSPVENPRRWKLVIVGISFSTILVRAIYHMIELFDGWQSSVATDQGRFNIFHGLMISLCMLALNIFHPGQLLGTRHNPVELGMRKKKQPLLGKPEDLSMKTSSWVRALGFL